MANVGEFLELQALFSRDLWGKVRELGQVGVRALLYLQHFGSVERVLALSFPFEKRGMSAQPLPHLHGLTL